MKRYVTILYCVDEQRGSNWSLFEVKKTRTLVYYRLR